MIKLTITIKVNLVGVLRELAGKSTVSLKIDSSAIVKDVISELTNSFSSEFKQALIDSELDDPRPNVLVLLNNKEIGVLDGLKTRVRDGDKLVLIPVSHGG
ncbi:MAG: MoaD/ThiS family protein [Candidatus Bathyarchaeota archaeon]|nr:MoaD/ThiS family protein [Candidatus Bathyarchaeota archaeon]MDH5495080.1 MoaD/ThiS family protein [Candidatus Bathyarchaeota archaeon]